MPLERYGEPTLHVSLIDGNDMVIVAIDAIELRSALPVMP
jgi:hypothetical protein